MLNPAVRQSLQQLSETFRAAQPFRHVVIDDFLEPSVAEGMLRSFPGFDARYALNEMGQVGGKAVREAVTELPEPYPQLDQWIQSRDFLAAMEQLTGIPDLLYDPHYFGGGTHENVDGQSLDMHIDFNYHPADRSHRRLNLIVYLNPEWEAAWGGCIEFAEDPWDPGNRNRKQVLPLFNRCVVFETNERSWHGFPRIQLPAEREQLSRRSFAIYLYTRERPPEETAPAHATVYVPDARPQHLVAGHVLSQADIDQLDHCLASANGQLKFLYEREKDFSAQIAALQHAVREANAAARVDVLGYARQIGAPRGIWPDGWSSRHSGLVLKMERACRSAVLRVWVPEALDGSFELVVAIDSVPETHRLRGGRVCELKLPLRAPAGRELTLEFSASADWMPSSDGASADTRALAFRLLDLSLNHD
jgi:hypothetical protein